jgi:WD40 repeat protein/mono/diheme cytochrome c family protein
MPRILSLLAVLACASPAFADPVSFKKDIAPALLNNCLACHGPKKAEGGYRVDTFERVMKPGESEGAPVTAKKPDESELLRRLTSDDKAERMPKDGDPLSAEQIALVKKWIEEGAAYDGGEPKALLSSIIPPPTHPAPPAEYRRPIPITAVAFTPDGQQLYVGGYHELTVWNPADGQLIKRINNINQRTFSISFSPDGKLIAVACGSPGRFGEVRILKAEDGSLVTVVGMTSDVVFDAQFSPQGDRLATAAADGVIRIFGTADWKEQLAITSHSDWVMAIAWSDDGSKLASGSRDKTSKTFDAKTGDLVVTFSQHNAPVKGVYWNADMKEVFSAGSDNQVRRWELNEAKPKGNAGFGDEVYKLSPGGAEFFFAASADKTVRQFKRADGGQAKQFNGMTDAALCVSYNAATNRVAAGGFDGRVIVWNVADGMPVSNFIAAPGYKAP